MNSSLTDIFQNASQAPTEEIVKEEIVVTKEATPDNLVYQMVSFSSYLYQLNTQAHLLHLNVECSNFLAIHEFLKAQYEQHIEDFDIVSELCLLYTSPSPRDGLLSRMPSSA